MNPLCLASSSTRASVASSVNHFKSRWGTRRLHQRQPLPYPVEKGLGNFLPPKALKVQLDYQDGLLERLNEQVVGTAEAGDTVAQTVINLSGKRDRILAFNYASLALNNSFFLNNLKPPSNPKKNHEHEISDQLHIVIRNAHGSIQQLRSAFSAAALGTFMNGWVWWVADEVGNTGIITTYGAGTLLVRSRSYMEKHPNFHESEPHDLLPSSSSPSSASSGSPSCSPLAQNPPPGTSPSSPLSGISGGKPFSPKSTQTRSFGEASIISEFATGIHSSLSSSKRAKFGSVLHAGEILYPLFCVPVYEHAWMSAGYGVWGKEEWLKKLWSVVNWQRVDAAYDVIWKAAQEKGAKRNY